MNKLILRLKNQGEGSCHIFENVGKMNDPEWSQRPERRERPEQPTTYAYRHTKLSSVIHGVPHTTFPWIPSIFLK